MGFSAHHRGEVLVQVAQRYPWCFFPLRFFAAAVLKLLKKVAVSMPTFLSPPFVNPFSLKTSVALGNGAVLMFSFNAIGDDRRDRMPRSWRSSAEYALLLSPTHYIVIVLQFLSLICMFRCLNCFIFWPFLRSHSLSLSSLSVRIFSCVCGSILFSVNNKHPTHCLNARLHDSRDVCKVSTPKDFLSLHPCSHFQLLLSRTPLVFLPHRFT